MKRKTTYAAVDVERVEVAALLPLLVAGCIVAVDVAKEKFVVAIATSVGEVVKLFRFLHPTQTHAFLRVLEELRRGVVGGEVVVAMEPTGVYGDAVRYAAHRLGVGVRMVSPKRTHDAQELFDGVPSLHDPKCAMIVARLAAMGLCTTWTPPAATRVGLRALVEQRRMDLKVMELSQGRLEALCARHWPELGAWMDVRAQRSALGLLASYGGPEQVRKAPEDQVRAMLREASRARLSREVIDGVLVSAKTFGVPMVDEEVRLMRVTADRALEAWRRAEETSEELRAAVAQDEVLARLATPLGAYTAAVIVAMCDPRQYASARQFEKACGLNLREKSSGETIGRLHITKRGPGLVRQVLYLFALRMVGSDATTRAWYMRRRGYTEETKRSAIVAVMRKLTRALWHVAKGEPFDSALLFDTRRLDVAAAEQLLVPRGAPAPRTSPRPIARGHRRSRTGAIASRANG